MEEQERLAAAEAAAVEDEDIPETSSDGKKGGKKKNMKKKKSSVQRKNTQKKITQGGGGDLTQKMFATMEKHKEVFFTIRLHSAQSAASLSPIQVCCNLESHKFKSRRYYWLRFIFKDPDTSMACDLMDGRDAFLTLAREKHLEFSSLRRTKYSSMVLLYELHTQGQVKKDLTYSLKSFMHIYSKTYF